MHFKKSEFHWLGATSYRIDHAYSGNDRHASLFMANQWCKSIVHRSANQENIWKLLYVLQSIFEVFVFDRKILDL